MTHIVRVALAKRGTWFFASSDDLTGLFVANPDLGAVYKALPDAIRLLFKLKLGLEVEVTETALAEMRPIDELVYAAEVTKLAA